MRRLVPYPLLFVGLILMWLLLTRFSLGQLILGSIISLLACLAMSALDPKPPGIRRWHLIPALFFIVFADIVRSNIAVAKQILSIGPKSTRRAGMVYIPLEIEDPTSLAILAIILTATPGTAWLGYNARTRVLALHVLDLVDQDEWRTIVKDRYERRLKEILE